MVVADAGPLIALAAVGQLHLLPQLFGRVLIPPGATMKWLPEALDDRALTRFTPHRGSRFALRMMQRSCGNCVPTLILVRVRHSCWHARQVPAMYLWMNRRPGAGAGHWGYLGLVRWACYSWANSAASFPVLARCCLGCAKPAST